MSSENRIVFVVHVVFVCFVQFSCTTDNLIDKEYEKNWKECYDDHLIFHEDSTILPGNYVKCILNNRNVLINSVNSNFQGSKLFYTSGSSTNPDITISPGEGTRNRIILAFIDYSDYWPRFSLVLDYVPDSINYLIRHTFSKQFINCSTNLKNLDADFMIGSNCSTGVTVAFSTFYSEAEVQQIKIDSFSYVCDTSNCYYHLEYSANELEITNSSWNSKSKYKHGDVNMKSKVLIENLPVKDLKVAIDFDFPVDN